jgi:hypothetical protein
MQGLFHIFLPVNSQTNTKITAIACRICINAPTSGNAKNPTNQSITIITARVNKDIHNKFPTY